MIRRLPLILGMFVALAALLLAGPVAVAVILLRSSSDAQGPALAAQILIGLLVVGLAASAGLAAWGLARVVIRLFRR